jgi:hypothetical protein
VSLDGREGDGEGGFEFDCDIDGQEGRGQGESRSWRDLWLEILKLQPKPQRSLVFATW